MGLIFEWDAKKAKSNLTKHGISFEEAATTFKDEDQITFEDDSNSYGEVLYLSIGICPVTYSCCWLFILN